MRPVRVDKANVLAELETNRAAHRAIFEEAIEGYRKEAIRQLETTLAQVRSGRPKRTYVSVPMPEDHTKDYDTAIEMLRMSVDDVVELDAQSFRSFFKDDWEWKRQFLTSNSSYSSTAREALASQDDD